MPKLLDVYWWKHAVYGLLEVDVTTARQFIEAHAARTGEELSFTGNLIRPPRAVDEDKSVQAFLKGRSQLVVCDDEDVSLPVERKIEGTHAPMLYLIRQANRKSQGVRILRSEAVF